MKYENQSTHTISYTEWSNIQPYSKLTLDDNRNSNT